MISNATHGNESPPPPRPVSGNTAAADVSFAKLNNEHHAESSSQAGSRSSLGRRSINSDKHVREGGKRWSGQDSLGPDDRSSSGSTPQRSRKSGGFLLESIFTNGKPRGPRNEEFGRQTGTSDPNGSIQVGRRTQAPERVSGESSQRASPLTREVSRDGPAIGNAAKDERLPSPGMDPAQLVQMALNLSESRKRHVSSTLPVPATPAAGRRIVSALDSGYGTVRSASSTGKRSSRFEDEASRSSLEPWRLGQQVKEQPETAINQENVLYTFSPATLSRAERARRYFELASEHRRLLEHLPPLKSDSTAPGNYTTLAISSPGSANYEMSRVPTNTNSKRQLGRSYNPLQALRNRRLRHRERRPLPASPDTWQKTDRTKHWIDGVEVGSSDPSFRPGEDRVRLPAFAGELETGTASPEKGKRHRRSDTASSVITRPENGWSIEPAELLADTYWLEMDDNKTVIEDRHGNRIFPPRVRLSVEVPRRSVDSRRSHDSNRDRPSQHELSEDEERPRARRRHMLPIPGRLRRHHVSRSASATSESSDEGRKPPPLRYGDNDGGDENVGPLERHMRSMIAKDERGELSSPEVVSPDHWNSRYTPFPNARSSVEKSRRSNDITGRGSSHTAKGRSSVDTAVRAGHRRSRSSSARVGSVDHGVTSMDEVMSDSPHAPSATEDAFLAQQGFSSIHKQASQIEPKVKKHRLPALHLHTRNNNKDCNNIERTDFANTTDAHLGKPLSPVLSADTSTGPPRPSFESFRPFVKRHRTNDSNGSSLLRMETSATNTGSVKDSSSTFGRRFFKGNRNGEPRADATRFGARFRGSRDHLEPGVTPDMSRVTSDVSDADDDPRGAVAGRRVDPADTDSQISPRASFERERTKPKFYTSNLPSFTSPAARPRSSTNESPLLEQNDPFSRHGGRTQRGTSSRPAPPRIQLPDEEGLSEPDLPSGKSKHFLEIGDYDRKKSLSQNNLSQVPTTSTIISRGKRKDSWPVSGLKGHDARRHWSISDRSVPPEQQRNVSHGDIARVRALLLASGIKAHQINLKADTSRDSPLPMMAKAARTAGKQWNNVSRKEEHIVASQMLTDSLSTTLSSFEHTLQHFQSNTAKELGSRLESLSHRVAEQLTKIVHEASDEADAFNVELTTKQPQEVKRVDEAVDAMFRQRRRQFRLVRRAGFKLLEWFVLGIMWWIWFMVVLINLVKKVVVGTFKVFRWLLWL